MVIIYETMSTLQRDIEQIFLTFSSKVALVGPTMA